MSRAKNASDSTPQRPKNRGRPIRLGVVSNSDLLTCPSMDWDSLEAGVAVSPAHALCCMPTGDIRQWSHPRQDEVRSCSRRGTLAHQLCQSTRGYSEADLQWVGAGSLSVSHALSITSAWRARRNRWAPYLPSFGMYIHRFPLIQRQLQYIPSDTESQTCMA